MIRLKEGVPTKVELLLTDGSTPIDGEATFVIFDKKDEIIRSSNFTVEGGKGSINLPKIKDNDYRFSIETDVGYSDLKDIKVSKSARGGGQEVTRSIHIDLTNERVEENKEEVNEFFTKNGNRLKSLEEVTQEQGKRIVNKEVIEGTVEKSKKEVKKDLEDFSKVVGKKIEGVAKELVSFEKRSETKTEKIAESLATLKTETNVKFKETGKKIDTITKAIGDISKTSEKNGLSISEKIKSVEKKIPSGGILDYEVNDEDLGKKILWSSEKIAERLRGLGNNKKGYVSYQNMFDTIAVAGQDSLQPTSPLDELNIVAGPNMLITTDNETQTLTFESLGGGGASSYEVTQAGHGFVDLDWLYFDESDSLFKKAQADEEATLGMWHVVEVVDTDTFKVAKDGVHEIANALALGEYVLSLSVAGGYTQTLPTNDGDLILYGMEVISSTHISFYSVPAIIVGSTGGGGGVSDGDKGDITVSVGGTVWEVNAGVIEESNLNTSVNASLDLADSALQAGDNVSSLTNDAGYATGGGTASGTNTGDQTITLTGDVTGSGTSSFAATIANDAVTYAKMQNVVANNVILGNNSGAGGVVDELTASEVRTIINVEDGAEVNNISDANATDLTDGGDTTLHTHDGRYYTESEVDTLLGGKQASDADLTAIAGLTPSNDDIIQRKAGAWTNRTMAQVKTDLVLVKGDVGLGNVDNTSDATKNSATATLTNKRITPRVGTTASSATPTINTDNVDAYSITALATNITSMTTNLSGTPTDFQKLLIRIKDDGTARTIARGASFQDGVTALPTTTVLGKTLLVGLMWDAVDSKWTCESEGSRA